MGLGKSPFYLFIYFLTNSFVAFSFFFLLPNVSLKLPVSSMCYGWVHTDQMTATPMLMLMRWTDVIPDLLRCRPASPDELPMLPSEESQ